MSAVMSRAVEAIRSTAESRQAALDSEAAQARVACVAALRQYATTGIPDDQPAARAVGEVVAHTLTVGRSDGYPDVSIPTATRAIIKAAIAAGIFATPKATYPVVKIGGLSIYADGSGLGVKPDEWDADYQAWAAAEAYRARQTWQSL